LRELRSATLGMESRKANISSFVLRGGSEVMFWEPQNSSLHHKGGEILSRWSQKVSVPTVSSISNGKHTETRLFFAEMLH
ncbi:hypothetical protein DW064_13350, partial [Segatella copri]